MRERAPTRWLARVGWLLLIWTLSVGALALVALLIRLLMHAAGMTDGH